MYKFKEKIVSVLIFPYDNVLEVRVARAFAFNSRIIRLNVYHAKYVDEVKVKRLAKLASKLNELILFSRIKEKATTKSPTA